MNILCIQCPIILFIIDFSQKLRFLLFARCLLSGIRYLSKQHRTRLFTYKPGSQLSVYYLQNIFNGVVCSSQLTCCGEAQYGVIRGWQRIFARNLLNRMDLLFIPSHIGPNLTVALVWQLFCKAERLKSCRYRNCRQWHRCPRVLPRTAFVAPSRYRKPNLSILQFQ